MSKPFDATLNSLIDEHVVDWAAYLTRRLGLPFGSVQVLDTDLSASLQADRLFRIESASPYILHLELESSGRLGIPSELHRYNTFVHHQTQLPVHSIEVLLRPKANASDLTGEYTIAGVTGVPYLRFEYTVIRVWEQSIEEMLAAGLGLAPLALLTNEASGNLEGAFDRFLSKLRVEDVGSKEMESLLGSLYVLCGLRYDSNQIDALYRNLSMTLEDSTTYQLIIAKGEARGRAVGMAERSRSLIVRLGAKRFGPIPESVNSTLATLSDPAHLDRIADRLLDATDWNDLVATP